MGSLDDILNALKPLDNKERPKRVPVWVKRKEEAKAASDLSDHDEEEEDVEEEEEEVTRPVARFGSKRGARAERRGFERPVPSISAMKEFPEVLEGAVRRGQVKKIASRVPSRTKDTSQIFSANGKLYAKTGLYDPTLGERVQQFPLTVKRRSSDWWGKNKQTIVVGSIAAMGLFFMYNAWRNAQQKNRYAKLRGGRPVAPHQAGFALTWPEMSPQGPGGFYERSESFEAMDAQKQIESMYPSGWFQ